MKICHISDLHWRVISRHEEYTKAFELFFQQMKEIKPDLIVNTGDLVHSKTLVSAELFDKLTWFFKNCCEHAPMINIVGNHDLALSNKNRLDAISPVLNALNLPNCYLYKHSGIYNHKINNLNVAFSVFSLFDKEKWTTMKPDKNADVNIALFHGTVAKSKTDLNWVMEHGEEYDYNKRHVVIDFFKDYDFTMLGDIHKQQFLDYRILEKRIVDENELENLKKDPNIIVDIEEELDD